MIKVVCEADGATGGDGGGGGTHPRRFRADKPARAADGIVAEDTRGDG